jgi:hypothetical protein
MKNDWNESFITKARLFPASAILDSHVSSKCEESGLSFFAFYIRMAALFRTPLLLQRTTSAASSIAWRNIGMSCVVMAKLDKNADPIQRLFAEKIQSYKLKSKDSGKLIGITPEMEANVDREIGQIKKRFGGGNLEEFPNFDFTDK